MISQPTIWSEGEEEEGNALKHTPVCDCEWMSVRACVFFGLIDSLFSTEHVSLFAHFAFVVVIVCSLSIAIDASSSLPLYFSVPLKK